MQVIFHQFSPTFVKIINKNSVLGNSLGRIHRYIDQNGPNMVLNGIQLTRVGDSSEMTIVAWLTIWTTLFRPYGFGINMFSLQFNTQNIVFYSPSPPPNRCSSSRAVRGRLLQFPNKNSVRLLYNTVRNVCYVGRLYGTRCQKNQISDKVEKLCLKTLKTIH